MCTQPPFNVLLAPSNLTFAASRGQTLLAAAEAAGIALPSSCRNGTCRTCISRVAQGRASHTIAWPGLSLEEKAQGFVLPCVACADSDVTLEVPAARLAAGSAA